MTNQDRLQIAESIKDHRNYLRLSQTFVANFLGIGFSTYNRIEVGKADISAIELQKLANLFRVNIERFFEPLRIDKSINELILKSAKFRSDLRAPSDDEGFHAMLRAIKDLQDWALIKTNEGLLKSRQEKARKTHKQYESVNKATEACLEMNSSGTYLTGDSFEIYTFIMNEIGPWLSWSPFGTFSGIYLELDHKDIKNKLPIIGINSEHSPERQRFSAAHELGHHLLKHKEKIGSPTKVNSEIEEKEANQFAANILMDENRVKAIIDELKKSSKDLDLNQIVLITARRLQVSLQALLNRLTSLGEISYEARETILKNQTSNSLKKIESKIENKIFLEDIINEAENSLKENGIYKSSDFAGPQTRTELRFLQDYSYVGYIAKSKNQLIDPGIIFQAVTKYVAEKYPRYKAS